MKNGIMLVHYFFSETLTICYKLHFGETLSIIALIPARNEATVGETVDSILRQSLNVDVIIVIANNCTDNGATSRAARERGAHVLDLGKIPGKKAGAMNRGLAYVASQYPDAEFILQMDADTIIEEYFVERTIAAMQYNSSIGGLCASFIGQDKQGEGAFNRFLIWAQQQEFLRFNGSQLSFQASVLSGTASLFRLAALSQLVEWRGHAWDESSIVEDYETTKALQDSGWLCLSDKSFIAYTDVMTSWSELLAQRMRWQSGTLQVIFRDYRGKRCVRFDTWRQYWAYGAFLPHIAGYALMAFAVGVYGFSLSIFALFWLSFGLYNGWKVRSLGWRKFTLAAVVIPVEAYNVLRYYWMYRSWKQFRNVPVGNQSW